jgi:hypothetical protein
VTQLGTGNALVVEDSTSPDATAFVIDQHGKVGIGVAPDANAALNVDTNGIKFGDGTRQTSAWDNGLSPILIWFSQNYFGTITSWSYDDTLNETTVYHSSDIVDAIANYVVDSFNGKTILLLDEFDPDIVVASASSYGAGFIVYSGDATNQAVQMRLFPQNITLPGYKKSFN